MRRLEIGAGNTEIAEEIEKKSAASAFSCVLFSKNKL
jgi:hypothetical protein